MKIKRILLMTVALFTAISFYACSSSSDDSGATTPSVNFKVSQTAVSMTSDVDTAEVTVLSNGQPTMSNTNDWLSVSLLKTGAYSYVYRLISTANTSTSSRTGTITFSYGSSSGNVVVTQAGVEKKEETIDTRETITGKDAMTIAKAMIPGWNLGNTLEAGSSDNNWTNNGGLSAETAWQGTKTTQAVIDMIKENGFKSVRIPCAWVMGHISDKDNCTIDETWMARVKEVVDYCINDNLFVIINDHWDGGWLEDSFSDVSTATVTANSEKLKKIWTQIAEEFKDYDQHLLFAGLNEPNENETAKTVFKNSDGINALYAYENAFIEAVRATGGNNTDRVLIVQGPYTDIDVTKGYFDISNISDTSDDRLMAEVHFYSPWQFAGLTTDESWGKMWYYWGDANTGGDSNRTTPTSYNEIYVSKQMARMKSQFGDNGIPVILGEYGANWRFANDELHSASVKAYYKAVNQYAIDNGCVPFAWDTNYTGYPSMTIFNRSSKVVFDQYMLDGITEGVNAGSWPY